MTTDDMRQPNILVTGNYMILKHFLLIFFRRKGKFLRFLVISLIILKLCCCLMFHFEIVEVTVVLEPSPCLI